MRIQDFKNNLAGGGARPNLFRVRGSFPSGGSGALGSALGSVAGAVGGDAGDLLGAANNFLGANGPATKLEFLVRAASLPSSTIGVLEIPYRGRVLKLPGDRTFASWSLTLLNDTDFAVRDAFEQWSDLINSHVQNVGPSGLNLVTTRWEVDQLGKDGSVLKTYTFEDCFPSEISQIDLSHDSTDTIEEFNVEMQFSYFTSNTTT